MNITLKNLTKLSVVATVLCAAGYAATAPALELREGAVVVLARDAEYAFSGGPTTLAAEAEIRTENDDTGTVGILRRTDGVAGTDYVAKGFCGFQTQTKSTSESAHKTAAPAGIADIAQSRIAAILDRIRLVLGTGEPSATRADDLDLIDVDATQDIAALIAEYIAREDTGADAEALLIDLDAFISSTGIPAARNLIYQAYERAGHRMFTLPTGTLDASVALTAKTTTASTGLTVTAGTTIESLTTALMKCFVHVTGTGDKVVLDPADDVALPGAVTVVAAGQSGIQLAAGKALGGRTFLATGDQLAAGGADTHAVLASGGMLFVGVGAPAAFGSMASTKTALGTISDTVPTNW